MHAFSSWSRVKRPSELAVVHFHAEDKEGEKNMFRFQGFVCSRCVRNKKRRSLCGEKSAAAVWTSSTRLVLTPRHAAGGGEENGRGATSKPEQACELQMSVGCPVKSAAAFTLDKEQQATIPKSTPYSPPPPQKALLCFSHAFKSAPWGGVRGWGGALKKKSPSPLILQLSIFSPQRTEIAS